MSIYYLSTFFCGISLIIFIVGFFIYLLAEKDFYIDFSAEDGNKKIGIKSKKTDSNSKKSNKH